MPEQRTDLDRSILRPGVTCWRHEPANRVAFLVDGADYFAAVQAAMAEARHRILVIGWDFDARIPLQPGAPPLRGLLNGLLARRPELQVHVLIWDVGILFALGRELVPVHVRDALLRRRLHVRLDGAHPLGACLHQKIVVIDDALAFCGGIDLTTERWDRPVHLAEDPGRRRPGGEPYGPVHDAMMAVDGAAAAALAELARTRWGLATGQALAPCPAVSRAPWPAALRPDLRHVPVGIARTEPAWNDRPEVREAEALFLESIAAARQAVYIENQYLAADVMVEALVRRLAEADGPEVVVVNPRQTAAWVEEETMGRARAAAAARLSRADRHGRFRLCAPVTGRDTDILVHAKVMVVDDRLLRIGSANLNNRSMGLDVECDLAVEAGPGDTGAAAAIAGFRNRLVAEHLGVTAERVRAAHAATGSLIGAIDSLNARHGRRLEPLRIPAPAGVEALLAGSTLLDPDGTVNTGQLARELVPDLGRPAARLRLALAAVGTLLLLAALALLWVWGDPGATDPASMLDWLERAARGGRGVLAMLAVFVVGSVLLLPVMALTALAAAVLGPVAGAVTSLAGALLSAVMLFLAGRRLGRHGLRAVADIASARLGRRIAERGAITVTALRIVPIAPFSVVNLVAGASQLRFTTFLIGTVVGLTPGVTAFTLLGVLVERALRAPTTPNLALALVVGGALVGAGWVANTLVRNRLLGRPDGSSHPGRGHP